MGNSKPGHTVAFKLSRQEPITSNNTTTTNTESSASGRTERTCPNQLNKLIWLLVESPSSTRGKIEHVGINVALQHRTPDPVLRLGPRTSIQPLGLNSQGPGTRAQAPLTNHHYPHETSIKVMSRIIGRQCKVLPGLT